MKYFSLNKQSPIVNFKEATILGQAPDKGLYFPERIPIHTPDFIGQLQQLSKEDIAFRVMEPFVGDTIPADELYRIVSETVNFPFPLKLINTTIASLELYHGPTFAFKDVGARFMSRCLSYFSKNQSNKITILVATSGDTGGAVANGFFGVEGIEVVILYPSGKVSPVQELQLTTCGENITALEVEGSFDDCQAMVKMVFADKDINDRMQLCSANSINVARWLSQQIYYFLAYQQWEDQTAPVISVPSGNFGNLCAGIMAYKTGLPVKHFIAACNVNDAVPDYLLTGIFKTKPTTPTISNAMDVGNPSNFVRILALMNQDYTSFSSLVSGYTISDEVTIETIREVHQQYDYLLDPHGAVAYAALKQYQQFHDDAKGYIVETADPVKFPDAIKMAIGSEPLIPLAAMELFAKEKRSIPMLNEYASFKEYLLSR
ncbi:MAG TPA: threonine synthase [Sediminibacterium sp.]|uniref:threonine synthase n=1 Tax=Sediminibacterium sp. TaxID=1917865 RepID=UPI0008D45D2E|nr:threonine synthase [Sediminibacterium sp.]OHC86614.1 MAG: threonine synthase [Sphingobacteriia bacterium RIFOXYC2_FULL_35_18]OHC88529.1 MAG: threonine synthase [Sphingobacteriia bacterium RIFOXYD2_FULL_35_12]HLD52034.1 threonine synthase [Sediminibacterium sp.]